jgi:ubiquinone/menaquinone biosynthesis C-methylase UbiE
MSSYCGRHAELYDVFYADKPYEQDAAFVHECLQHYSVVAPNQLLELACGTGSHALALERYGYKIVAVDYSPDMLSRAQRKAEKVSSKIEFYKQDMRSLDLQDIQFDAVICLFDSIGYVATNQGLIQVLEGVHHLLKPGGLFIFEFWHAGAMLRNYEPLRVRRWSTPRGELLRISETTLQCAPQLSSVTYRIYELNNDGTYSSIEETQVNRYFLVQEMSAWLSNCGFLPLKWFSGFTDNESITEQTWHVVAVAQKA